MCLSLKKFIKKSQGQSMVEFAILAPILLLIVFAIIDFGRIYSASIIVTGAAREGARAAAVGGDDEEITEAIEQYASVINDGELEFEISPPTRVSGQFVTITVSNPMPVITPLMDKFLGSSFMVNGSAVMRVE